MPSDTAHLFAEFFRISFEESEDGLWLSLLDKPLPVNLPIDRQEDHLFKYAYLAECNASCARLHGYADPDEMAGIRLPQMLLLSDPANLAVVRLFLSSAYHFRNVETHERARNGEDRYFLTDFCGIVEGNFLRRIWGRQRDITLQRLRQLSFDHLTPLQLSVLKLTVQGKTLKEISQSHNITEKTVDTIRSRLKKKFGAKTIPELAAHVARLGLLEPLDPCDDA